MAAYEALGGLEGALSGQANAAYEALDAEEQRITEVLFRRLSTRTTSGRDIRLPTRLEEVARVAEVSSRDSARRGRRLPRSRLLLPHAALAAGDPGPTSILDISHESLIRHWGRLRGWVGDEAASADVYRRLDQTARLWSEGLAGLWGAPDLDQALRWKEEARPNKAWADRYGGDLDRALRFLDASVTERDRMQTEERRRLSERVDQNHRLAEAERLRAEVAEAHEREAKAAAGRQKKLSQRLAITAALARLLALAAGIQTWRESGERTGQRGRT